MSIKDFTEKLASSDLTIEDAEQLHIEYYSSEQTKRYASFALDMPSMRFHYYDPNGEEYSIDKGRIRYLGKLTGFLEHAKKKPRYLQYKGARPLPYFPQNINWNDVINDPEKTIYITEGELKAACLSKHGLPCIGLGGVFNFMSKRLNLPIIPELEQLKLQNRKVIIVFDADSIKNRQVQNALDRLCDQLMSKLGAIPIITELPIIDDNEKTGVDDFIVAKGIDEFKKLESKEYHQFSALVKFNDRCVYISSTGEFYDLEQSTICKKRHAETTFATNRIDVRNNKGNYISKPILNEWLEWRNRREVNKLIFDPSLPPKEIIDNCLNIWKGFPHLPKEGNINPWLDFLEHLIPFKKDREYIKNWIAWRFQNPGIKPHTALVFWSNEQGTGKSTFCNILCEVLGEEYSETITPEMLSSQFNPWMIGKLAVMVEEIYSFGRNNFPNKLKAYITQKKAMINEKGINAYPLKDVTSFIFNSNKSNAVYFDNFDRRYYVVQVTNKLLDYRIGKELNEWSCTLEAKQALLYEFLTCDLKDFDARAPAPLTEAKITMHRENLCAFEDWLYMVEDTEIFDNCKILTANNIAEIYALQNDDPKPPSPKTVGIYLRLHKFKKVGNDPHKGISVNGIQRTYWCMDRGNKELESFDNGSVRAYLKEHISLERKF